MNEAEEIKIYISGGLCIPAVAVTVDVGVVAIAVVINIAFAIVVVVVVGAVVVSVVVEDAAIRLSSYVKATSYVCQFLLFD